jgi:hypothetical protein
MHPPHFMEPQGSLHFSTQPITCPYPELAKLSPRKHTIFLSDSFYITCLYTGGHFLSGIRTKDPGYIASHSKTCHKHCPSHSSGCCSVPSSVSVSLERVASILLVLADGKLLTILLLIIKECVHGEKHIQILATWTHKITNLGINKSYIIKKIQGYPTCNSSV